MSAETAAKAKLTTIKVPQPLRQRIAGDAAEQGVTAATFLAGLLDRYDRDRRFEQVRRAYAASDADSDYTTLTESWERASASDLDQEDGA